MKPNFSTSQSKPDLQIKPQTNVKEISKAIMSVSHFKSYFVSRKFHKPIPLFSPIELFMPVTILCNCIFHSSLSD